MDLINEMKNLGADMDSALERFMGKSQLLEMMLKKLPDSIEQNSGIECDIATGNLSNAISKTHTLKGNTGNLSVTPLYKAYTEITDFLRQEKIPEAQVKLQEILPVQNKIVETIKKHL